MGKTTLICCRLRSWMAVAFGYKAPSLLRLHRWDKDIWVRISMSEQYRTSKNYIVVIAYNIWCKKNIYMHNILIFRKMVVIVVAVGRDLFWGAAAWAAAGGQGEGAKCERPTGGKTPSRRGLEAHEHILLAWEMRTVNRCLQEVEMRRLRKSECFYELCWNIQRFCRLRKHGKCWCVRQWFFLNTWVSKAYTLF